MDNGIKTTWVVVAHKAGARFMEHRSGFGRHLNLVRELDNPDGRKKNQELDTDRPGEGASSGGRMMRRAMLPEQTAHEHVAITFAQTLASELTKARAEGAFDQLILVAEPGFLGLLREALDKPTRQAVIDSVNKNLAVEQPNEVAQHIGRALPL